MYKYVKSLMESTGNGSTEFILPAIDARRTTERQEIVLLIKLYRHRSRGILLSLGKPFPEQPTSRPRVAKVIRRLK